MDMAGAMDWECQWGAEAMAEKHDKDDDDYYKDILSHYYTDTEITKIY